MAAWSLSESRGNALSVAAMPRSRAARLVGFRAWRGRALRARLSSRLQREQQPALINLG